MLSEQKIISGLFLHVKFDANVNSVLDFIDFQEKIFNDSTRPAVMEIIVDLFREVSISG